MNTGELLRYLRVDILHDNSQQIAGSGDDQLWSDESLITNINEAYRRFARLTLAIRDASTPAVCEVTLEEGVDEYTLHKAVFAVMSARLEDTHVDLSRAGHSMFQDRMAVNTRFWDPSDFYSPTPGAVRAFSTDEGVSIDDAGNAGTITLRVYPVPDETMDGKKLYLRVIRMPIDRLVLTDLGADLEIAEDHHIEMLDWAAYLCLRTVDLDEGAPDRAQEFATAFDAHVSAGRRLAMRKMFAPRKWAFGRNAFHPWEK